MLLFILFLVICCTNKSSKNQEILEKEEVLEADTLQTNVDNFLVGNIYHYITSNDADNREESTLIYTKDGIDDSNSFVYGTYISFRDSLHFEIYNTAPCGNDCFFSTMGKYYLPTDDEFVLVLDSTINFGFCEDRSTIYMNSKMVTYKMMRTNNDSIIQLKINQ